MKNLSLHTLEFPQFSIDQIVLENVTFTISGYDSILKNVDCLLPTDQTVLVESSLAHNSVGFLKLISGQEPPQSGKVLWNNIDIFSTNQEVNPHDFQSSYFDGMCLSSKKNLEQVLKNHLNNYFENEVLDLHFEQIIEQFDLQNDLSKHFYELSYGQKKLISLVVQVAKAPQILILEDPASGLSEQDWLNFLDYIQLNQRRGAIRHLFLTNHHPVALNHLEHRALYIEDGLIFIEEADKGKKVAHF